jgi:hypothetical protein
LVGALKRLLRCALELTVDGLQAERPGMSSDLIGRRRASEQRLDRARSLELTLKEKTDILVETTGIPIEQLDFDGSFRAALTALAAVAARRTTFDIIVTLPDAPFAMRIQHINDAVSAEVLVQGDGAFEPVGNQADSVPDRLEPSQPESAYAVPAYATPAYSVSSAAYSESVTAAEPVYVITAEKQPVSVVQPAAAQSVPTTQVASDLAALLWEGLGDMPS